MHLICIANASIRCHCMFANSMGPNDGIGYPLIARSGLIHAQDRAICIPCDPASLQHLTDPSDMTIACLKSLSRNIMGECLMQSWAGCGKAFDRLACERHNLVRSSRTSLSVRLTSGLQIAHSRCTHRGCLLLASSPTGPITWLRTSAAKPSGWPQSVHSLACCILGAWTDHTSLTAMLV